MKETAVCRFNFAIDCEETKRNCSACGWNPEVNAARIERMKEKSKRGVPLKNVNKRRR